VAKPAQRALDLILQRHPDATVESRDRASLTCDAGDRKAAVAMLGAMHYQEPGDPEWKPIDTAWQPTAGAWQLEMLTAPYRASARDAFNVGEVLEYRAVTGEWVRFQPLALNWRDEDNAQHQIATPQAVATVVDDDVLRWPDGYGPGRSMSWHAHPTRLQKVLRVDAASDLPEPTVAGSDVWLEVSFAFTFDASVTAFVDGVAWDRSVTLETGESIEFRSAGGEVLWSVSNARAWDSAGAESPGVLRLSRQGNVRHVAVRIPKEFVDEAVFPLFVDPTIEQEIQAGTDDGYYRVDPEDFRASDASIPLGDNGTTQLSPGFRFQLPLPPASIVAQASLRVVAAVNAAGTVVRARIACDATDDAATFSTAADFTGRTRTTATVNWHGIPAWTQGQAETSPDFAAVVQEVIDRPGWAADNHLAILIDEDGARRGPSRRSSTPRSSPRCSSSSTRRRTR
jgi:hypothetical protein